MKINLSSRSTRLIATFPRSFSYRYFKLVCLGLAETTLLPLVAIPSPSPDINQPSLHLQVVVNSDRDGAVQADNALTLREAIHIVNGTLPLDKLSDREKTQVQSLSSNAPSRIVFNLPPQQTTIRLSEILPALATPGLVIDGTTQPGYVREQEKKLPLASRLKPQAPSLQIPTPVVTITPAKDREIFRGLTVVADNVTIRGLSLYGFTSFHRDTATTPPANIFIVDRLSPSADVERQNDLSVYEHNNPSKGVLIEYNWLGLPPDASKPSTTSAFGVSVFNGVNATIRRNRIANHDGSGIITSVKAENLQVTQNIIQNNGFAGMPDAIRLEGSINGANVSANLISGNAGSRVFLFKPEGAVQIHNNTIKSNGRRLERAAIYLMGNDHQVINNSISDQPGPGVVVTSYPKSDRNIIRGNRFAAVTGLSIDLNTQENVDVQDYQRGDGSNPKRNSPNRRLETGNSAINAPQFLSQEFLILNNKVTLVGNADPGSLVDIYLVKENNSLYGPLSEPLATVKTNDKARFSITLKNLKPGDRISAIATNPRYGTSEPALNTVIHFYQATKGNSLSFTTASFSTVSPLDKSLPIYLKSKFFTGER